MKQLSIHEVIKQSRGSWNGINPTTKIIPDKKKGANKKKCRERIDF